MSDFRITPNYYPDRIAPKTMQVSSDSFVDRGGLAGIKFDTSFIDKLREELIEYSRRDVRLTLQSIHNPHQRHVHINDGSKPFSDFDIDYNEHRYLIESRLTPRGQEANMSDGHIQPYQFEKTVINKKASELAQEDIGSLIKVRTIEGVEFQDVLREISASSEYVFLDFDHVRIMNDAYGRSNIRLDPRSKAAIKRPREPFPDAEKDS